MQRVPQIQSFKLIITSRRGHGNFFWRHRKNQKKHGIQKIEIGTVREFVTKQEMVVKEVVQKDKRLCRDNGQVAPGNALI